MLTVICPRCTDRQVENVEDGFQILQTLAPAPTGSDAVPRIQTPALAPAASDNLPAIQTPALPPAASDTVPVSQTPALPPAASDTSLAIPSRQDEGKEVQISRGLRRLLHATNMQRMHGQASHHFWHWSGTPVADLNSMDV